MTRPEHHHLIQGPLASGQQRTPVAAVLMTATLRPPANAVVRSDPQDRLGDYLEALRFYLDMPDDVVDRVVFVENTASDLQPLVDLARTHAHGKTVEFIGFWGNDHDPRLGKAYGEFKLMDHGLARATVLRPDDTIWKTTGRLKFLNLAAMARKVSKRPFDFLCDLHNVPGVGSPDPRERKHMDLRVFAFRLRAYDQVVRGLWQRQSHAFDAADMFHAMMGARAQFKVTPRFPLQPQLQGISGRHGRDYQSSSQRAKDGVRAFCRRFLPWLWL
jgi:hypothetical protein